MSAILLALFLSAPGDVQAILHSGNVTLDASGNGKLNSAAHGSFPGVGGDALGLKWFYCRRDWSNADLTKQNDLDCKIKYDTKDSEAVYTDARVDGKAHPPKGRDGADISYHRGGDARTNPASKVLIGVFYVDVFTPLGLPDLDEFTCDRSLTKTVCRTSYFDTVPEDVFVTLDLAGSVKQVLGREP